jgi:hypothetical protein
MNAEVEIMKNGDKIIFYFNVSTLNLLHKLLFTKTIFYVRFKNTGGPAEPNGAGRKNTGSF